MLDALLQLRRQGGIFSERGAVQELGNPSLTTEGFHDVYCL